MGFILPLLKLSSEESQKSHEPLKWSALQPHTEEILVNLAFSHQAIHAGMFFQQHKYAHTCYLQSSMHLNIHVYSCSQLHTVLFNYFTHSQAQHKGWHMFPQLNIVIDRLCTGVL